jgi:sirohydrochlorin cobaltochelatase
METPLPKDKSQALLLTAFGTTIPEAYATFENMTRQFAQAFPNTEIRWAFTSAFVRNKWKSHGKVILSPAAALTQLADEGFKKVGVQSLHVIHGFEYHDILNTAKALEGLSKGIERIKVGEPLLSSHTDYKRLCGLIQEHAHTFRQSGEALLLMGHGSSHPANIAYAGLQEYFRRFDPSIYVATIESYPALEDVIPQLRKAGYKNVWLMPLLTIAGNHVLNDMAGEKAESWQSILLKEGFEVKIHSTSLGQISSIVQMWIDKALNTTT